VTVPAGSSEGPLSEAATVSEGSELGQWARHGSNPVHAVPEIELG